MSAWRIELLGKQHDRSNFDCGRESLNRFLRQHAGQNARKDISRTYIVVPVDSQVVAAYYTLSGGSISFEEMPEDHARRLPHYPIPTALIGRLAVDNRYQGRGLGAITLSDALKRLVGLADQIGIHAVTVHALDDNARSFYRAVGFLPLKDDAYHLYLPMATVRQL